MNLCKVTSDTVAIPVIPEFKWWEYKSYDPSLVVGIQKRYVSLHYREFKGRIIAMAYDRETDTLFIKDE